MATNEFEKLAPSLNSILGGSSTTEEIYAMTETLLEEYKSKKEDWEKYVVRDESIPYARSIVADGNGKYNLLLLCWNPKNGSPIHNHENSQCFVKILEGELTETKYHKPENDEEGHPMTVTSGPTTYKENEVTYIADAEEEVHKMENKSTELCVSLHVYIPPYPACKVYDVRTSAHKEAEMHFQKDCRKDAPHLLGA